MKTILEEEFYDKFTLVVNHIDKDASFDGNMFEIFGKEVDFIKDQPNENIWTIGIKNGDFYIDSGYHLINRIGYFITEEPWTEDTLVKCT